MEGADGVAGGVVKDGEGQASPGEPGSHDGGHQDPRRGGSGEAQGVARDAPQVAQGQEAAEPRADAMPAPEARNRRPLQYILLVPFHSSVQAEIACHLLSVCAEPQPGAGQQEVRVSGSRLAIRLTAEDMDQLRLSISSCVQELFVLMEVMQHIRPPFFFLSPRIMNGG